MPQLCRVTTLALALLGVGALAGCGSTDAKSNSGAAPSPAATQTKKQEVVFYTGQEAFSRMLALAIRWAPDAQPVHIESEITAEGNGQGGKAPVWRGFFASASRRAVKTFVCSGSRLPDAPPFGVSAGGAESALSPEIAAAVFQPFLLKSDTDKAFAVTQEHGGDKLLKKDAKQPVTYLLAGDRKQGGPVWYVVYGKSMADKKGIGIINANTGAFVGAR